MMTSLKQLLLNRQREQGTRQRGTQLQGTHTIRKTATLETPSHPPPAPSELVQPTSEVMEQTEITVNLTQKEAHQDPQTSNGDLRPLPLTFHLASGWLHSTYTS
ncbi:hypothetical protein ILYODFUR_019165 [Ilyodon furcidens]|uniref:Uncharacterized protein n=1 Tax=Ilyodon furcidens TaxID=33524 RepID=A0ABV0V4A7_9TELE